MARGPHRENVLLGAEHGAKLQQMAERVHVSPETLARSLLSQALDGAEPSSTSITALLDSIDGAFAHAEAGWVEASQGHIVDLEEM